jgi:hypothetical protein
MPHFLLIGAGFSRNWGGWLASEAFEYLLGSPQVMVDASLRDLLWKHQDSGGFESALDELQRAASNNPEENGARRDALNTAVLQMFKDMNEAILRLQSWGQSMTAFLTKFDAIFSLNQDLLIEHLYMASLGALLGSTNQRWPAGAHRPGVRQISGPNGMQLDRLTGSIWTPENHCQATVPQGAQPFFKLHGSSDWIRSDGTNLLVIGGAKSASIQEIPLLTSYFQEFERSLQRPGARLMTIGYGFADQHINATIQASIGAGLRLFIIDPRGPEIARSLNPTRRKGAIVMQTELEIDLQRALIGASRRSIRDAFPVDRTHSDAAECGKIMRFFEVN